VNVVAPGESRQRRGRKAVPAVIRPVRLVRADDLHIQPDCAAQRLIRTDAEVVVAVTYAGWRQVTWTLIRLPRSERFGR